MDKNDEIPGKFNIVVQSIRDFDLDVAKLQALVPEEFNKALEEGKLHSFIRESFYELIVDPMNRDEDHTGLGIVKLVSEDGEMFMDY